MSETDKPRKTLRTSVQAARAINISVDSMEQAAKAANTLSDQVIKLTLSVADAADSMANLLAAIAKNERPFD